MFTLTIPYKLDIYNRPFPIPSTINQTSMYILSVKSQCSYPYPLESNT